MANKKMPTTELTKREKRVLLLVTRAKTNKEIAIALNLSPLTVERHIENILQKIKMPNRVAAAIYGLTLQCPDPNCFIKNHFRSLLRKR